MVLRIVTGFLASSYGFVDHLRKVLPLGVSQEQLKVPRTPELGLRSREFLNDRFEVGMQPNHDFSIHRVPPFVPNTFIQVSRHRATDSVPARVCRLLENTAYEPEREDRNSGMME